MRFTTLNSSQRVRFNALPYARMCFPVLQFVTMPFNLRQCASVRPRTRRYFQKRLSAFKRTSLPWAQILANAFKRAHVRLNTLYCTSQRLDTLRYSALRLRELECSSVRVSAIRCPSSRFAALRCALMRIDAPQCALMRHNALQFATLGFPALRCAFSCAPLRLHAFKKRPSAFSRAQTRPYPLQGTPMRFAARQYVQNVPDCARCAFMCVTASPTASPRFDELRYSGPSFNELDCSLPVCPSSFQSSPIRFSATKNHSTVLKFAQHLTNHASALQHTLKNDALQCA
jgi:hypothetical protein